MFTILNAILISLFFILSLHAHADEISAYTEVLPITRDLQEIINTKVATEAEARRLSFKAYAEKMKLHVSAMEGGSAPRVITLGLELPGFAKKGVKIWEARIISNFFSTRGIVWVNPESSKVYFVAGAWEVPIDRDTPTTYTTAKILGRSTDQSIRIEGARLSTQVGAKSLAIASYNKKMSQDLQPGEDVRMMSVSTLGYAIPGFAGRGERLWEARISTPDGELRSILWINPHTEQVRFLIGPWVADEDRRTTGSATMDVGSTP